MPKQEEYEELQVIGAGKGSFGTVRKVKHKLDGHILCRKEISYEGMSHEELEQLRAEVSIIGMLSHPNIVTYSGHNHISESKELHLYMEYCKNGDLRHVIEDLKEKKKDCQEQFVWSIFSQIVSALYRCHFGADPPAPGMEVMPIRDVQRVTILHRDIKPENIFLDDKNGIKLGDFGGSKILMRNDLASTYIGTPYFMSPEIFKQEQYGPQADIWALGCTIYQICAKAPPFDARTSFNLINKINSGQYPDIPSCYSAELRRVIASCLQTDVERRPDAAELLNLPTVSLMREVHQLREVAQNLRSQTLQRAKEAGDMMSHWRKEVNDRLREEWEVKAKLEIDRQVKIHTAQQVSELHERFEGEVKVRVAETLQRLSSSPKLAPLSVTPLTGAVEPGVAFPSKTGNRNTSGSAGGSNTNGRNPGVTDVSSLSLEDTIAKGVQAMRSVEPKHPKIRRLPEHARTVA